jgi:hypothetical protein
MLGLAYGGSVHICDCFLDLRILQSQGGGISSDPKPSEMAH